MNRNTLARSGLVFPLVLCFFLGLFGCASSGTKANTPRIPKKEMKAAMDQLPERYKQFLEDVEPLITDDEKNIFLQFKRDFERDEFIEKFWKVRSLNEDGANIPFRQIYYSRLELIKEMREHPSYRLAAPWLMAIHTNHPMDPSRDPARIFLLNGPPDASKQVECDNATWPIQIWFYAVLPSIKQREITLVFYKPGNYEYQLWLPMDGVQALLSNPTYGLGQAEGNLYNKCFDWMDVQRALSATTVQLGDMMAAKTAADLITPAPTNIEGAERVLWMSIDIDPKAPKLTYKFFDISFEQGTENMNKTKVDVAFTIPKDQLAIRELAGEKFYNLDVVFRLVENRSIGKKLILARRFRFDFKVDDSLPKELPITISDEVYPAEYLAFAKLIDANDKTDRQAAWEEKVRIPYVDVHVTPQPSKPVLVPAEPASEKKESQTTADISRTSPPVSVPAIVPKNEREISPIIILPPGRTPLLGVATFEARIAKDILPFVAYVEFFANTGKTEVVDPKGMRKNKPPFSVDLDMGPVPRRQTVRAIAFDKFKKELCRYELGVNQGAHSFAVRLIAPTGSRASGETKLQAAVFAPEGRTVEGVRFYVNDEVVKTLQREPWIATAKIRSDALTSVRVVANLDDGTIAEDMRYVNLPGFTTGIDVNVVELFVVVKENEQVVDNLKAKNFEISEDGVPQKIEAFEYAKNSPITVGVAIDTSCSMDFGCFKRSLDIVAYSPKQLKLLERYSLRDVQQVAIAFLNSVLGPQDRGFTMNFSEFPNMLMPLTNDKKKLTLSLAGLRAEGATAIYDTLMQALYEVQDIKGKKALVLLTDGEDNRSAYDFATALDYAKRAGISVYTIGFRMELKETKAKLEELARVSGGKAYFVNNADELKGTYKEIEAELRSQYIITYYSHSGTKNWRTVEVKTTPKKFKVRTIAGYYP